MGGGITQFPVWEHPYKFDVICRPDLIPKGTRVVNALQLGRVLLSENIDKNKPIKSMMCWNANPVTQATETEKIIEGLKIKYCGYVLDALLIERLPSRYGMENADLPIMSTSKTVYSKISGF